MLFSAVFNLYFFRFPIRESHNVILSLLEHFEIVYKIRIGKNLEPREESDVDREQMFFVPSLLSPCQHSTVGHPSIEYWNQIESTYVLPIREVREE
jgi:hypothetical protein